MCEMILWGSGCLCCGFGSGPEGPSTVLWVCPHQEILSLSGELTKELNSLELAYNFWDICILVLKKKVIYLKFNYNWSPALYLAPLGGWDLSMCVFERVPCDSNVQPELRFMS